jgi:hypothetical protein
MFPKIRIAIASLMLAGAAMAAAEPAAGQAVQYQYTPPPPIVALPSQLPGPATIPGVASPVPAPPVASTEPQQFTPPRSVKPLPSLSPRFVQVPNGPVVVVPPARPHASYSERYHGCIHAGTAAGLSSSQLGSFGVLCAQ